MDEVHNTALGKGWYDTPIDHDPSTKLILIICEITEAFEELRGGCGLDEIYYQEDGKPEGVPVELADAIIRILDFSARNQLPLLKALREKAAYNDTRPYRHGNKTA